MEITILGQTYLLACPEGGEDAMMAAVAAVDREMTAIRDGGKIKARERIAVLAALNLAYAQAGAPAPREENNPAPLSGDASRIERLVERIDQVLAADGQLL